MSGLSTYSQVFILDWIREAGAFVALFDGDPTDAGTGGALVTVDSRVGSRAPLVLGAATGGNTVASSAEVSFGSAADAGAATHAAIYDAAVGGNMLISGPLTRVENGETVPDAKAWNPADVVRFPAGSLTFTLD